MAAVVAERGAQFADDGAQRVFGHRVGERVEVHHQVLHRQRRGRGLLRDHRAVLQERSVVALGPQVDVLLADRRPVGHHGLHVGGDSRRAGFDVQRHLDPAAGQPDGADPAHRHAAVGDLGVVENAAGVG